jgi:hypothetical protein
MIPNIKKTILKQNKITRIVVVNPGTSCTNIIALLVLIIKRQEFETYLKGIKKPVISKKPYKGRKPDK